MKRYETKHTVHPPGILESIIGGLVDAVLPGPSCVRSIHEVEMKDTRTGKSETGYGDTRGEAKAKAYGKLK